MKKLSFFMILLALLVLISACGGSDDNKQNENESDGGTQQEGVSDVPGNPDDETDDNTGTEDDGNLDTDSSQDGESEVTSDPNLPVQITKRKDGKITVDFQIPDSANKYVSIILLSDASVLDNWQTNLNKVVAIEQLTADASGKGSVTVNVERSASYAVVVTYLGGCETTVLTL